MARLTGTPARVFVPGRHRPRDPRRHHQRGRQGNPDRRYLRRSRRHGPAVGRKPPRRRPRPGHRLARLRAGAQLDRRGLLHPVRRTRRPANRRRRWCCPHWWRSPVGVGSLAQAAVVHYRAHGGQGDVTAEGWPGRGQNSAPEQPSSVTAVLSVEPDTAACLLASLRAGRPTTIPTAATIMAGLNCGTISSIAWPYFSSGLDAAVAVTDDAARRAAADLAAAGLSSGPSGASSLAGARAALTGADSEERRAAVGVDPASVIVLLSTEAAHPPQYTPFLSTRRPSPPSICQPGIRRGGGRGLPWRGVLSAPGPSPPSVCPTHPSGLSPTHPPAGPDPVERADAEFCPRPGRSLDDPLRGWR